MAALLTSCANGDAEKREEGTSSPQPQRGGGQHQTATAVNCRGVQNCLCMPYMHVCVTVLLQLVSKTGCRYCCASD